jgi:hypothetical protein
LCRVSFTGLLPWIYNVLTEYGHLPGAVSVFSSWL